MTARRMVQPEEGRAALAAALAGVRGAQVASSAATDDPVDTAGASIDRATLRTAVRYTLQLLAARAPGHSVEVRVPPLAAIQAIPGPVHRRGTPSAVVEMSPSTWLLLATGDLSWDQAHRSGLVRASGERADLTAWLPLAP